MANKPKLSKRYSLAKLDPLWREKIFASIKSPKLKLAVAVLSCTGCRPAELEEGIVIRVRNGQLIIGILGAKVDTNSRRGQPFRLLVIDSTSPWGYFLLQYGEMQVDKTVKIYYDAGGVSQRLREKSREIWPRRITLVSGYTYRHFIGKSMKESGESAQKIASTLGHATDFSQSCYGRVGGSKKSAGKHGVLVAQATNPIRHVKKTDRLERFISQVIPKPAI